MNELEIFKISQGQAAALLGVGTEEIRRLRKKALVEGPDWERRGNQVWFCEGGLEKMRRDIALPPVDELTAAKKTPGAGALPLLSQPVMAPTRPGGRRVFCLPDAPPTLAQVRELVVYRTVANPQIVEAHLAGLGADDRANIMRVRVRDSAHFTRGMVMAVRLLQAPDLFEFTGRLPRWRGKY